MENTSVVVSDQDKLNALVNPNYTGHSEIKVSRFPPVINVLQNDKQYLAFGSDGMEITKKLYGKLFVHTQVGNKLSDLEDEIVATVLKIEEGHEVFEITIDNHGKKKMGKIVASYPYMVQIPSEFKDKWKRENPGKSNKDMTKAFKAEWCRLNPGFDYRNMKKIVLARKLEDGSIQKMLLPIKGGAWGSWFTVERTMDSLTMASSVYGHKSVNEVAITTYRFVIGSEEGESEDGEFSGFYYPVVKGVELNDPSMAYEFLKMSEEMKDFSLFFKVAEDIADREVEVVPPYVGGKDNLDEALPTKKVIVEAKRVNEASMPEPMPWEKGNLQDEATNLLNS